MDNFYNYIKERSSIGGCNANKWNCVKYLDCDMCFRDKIAEHEKRIRAKVIEEYKHNLKETFNNEFPTNFHCTKPYFTLDNVRVLTDAVAREMKEQNNDSRKI